MSNETWKCLNCGTENAGDDNFCSECGGKKPVVGIGMSQTVNKVSVASDESWNCPNCGTENAGDDNFCGECGTKKPASNQNIYSPMSNEELMKIERWSDCNDGRTDSELLKDVDKYLSDADLLKNYVIVRNVSPEIFNADATIQKYYGDMGENSRGEKFSANKYGRPVSFVIKDADNNVKMMIMVAKDSSFSHWLVKWCQLWCKDHNIPLLKLHTGAANTEHYVVRRVYEIMGFIKTSAEKIACRNPKTGEMCYR